MTATEFVLACYTAIRHVKDDLGLDPQPPRRTEGTSLDRKLALLAQIDQRRKAGETIVDWDKERM